ncbi:MAG: hypothetical protein NT040_01915 [Bacteroidetes bacterium]|nr:hypothetical protein [Bacteroidota bacterium]
MPKKKTPPAESQNEGCPEESENILENVKYINKLTLQRIVLSRLVEVELQPDANKNITETESPEKATKTKKHE